MAEPQTALVKEYRIRGENVLLYHEDRFLLIPTGEVVRTEEDGICVLEETLQAAFDVTPDLPPRILASAWRNRQVFLSEVTMEWATGVARQHPLSAHQILQAYQRVGRSSK